MVGAAEQAVVVFYRGSAVSGIRLKSQYYLPAGQSLQPL